MNGPEPDTPGGGPGDRGVDAAVWVAVIAAMVGLASGFAWLLSNSRIEFREVTYEDRVGERTLIEPVPPPPVAPRMVPSSSPPPEPSPTTGPNGEVVKVPVWVRVPAPEYPRLAMRRGVESGAVTLRCEALSSGEIGACEVLAEHPAGVGFAEAALRGARNARVKPRSIDGFETDSTIQYTVRFQTAPEP
ncbi:MAG: energy transducer TonB [Brevundimonas sp.]